ncbi:acyl-CoA synthetase [Microbacterium aurantiacum]|uniref:Long-chain fatty acid--CoA ligase n=1 Tax=Microbacterium aurantiacum TaxID=162393 RepID=A0ABT8FUS3_9MICO|nr:long-chain fatty acid--CoA ligase [Microbacterium aurantiacum]MDN4464955.1 long-chain fatty acid--CoA ligase [Microbacterium aurantiacum]
MRDEGIGRWLPRRRLKDPAKPALVFGDEVITYGEFADTAARLGTALRARGVAPGESVAFFGENSPHFLTVMFAASHIGAVFVPVNTRLAPPEIAHVLADSGARVVVHEPAAAERMAAAAPGVARVSADELAGIAASVAEGETPADLEPHPTDADAPAAIIYTSGTTGRAKGAVLSHRNLTWVALNTIIDYDVVSSDIALMISPLFHVASLGMGALPVLLKGATMVLEPGFEPGRALGQIARHGVTMLSGVPTTYQMMADHPEWAATDLSSLRKLTCGGSAVPERILNAYELRGLSFSQGYGMTETSPGATSLSPAMTRRKQGSVGLPHFFTDVRVRREDGRIADTGEIGEVEITGPNVFLGYHGLPEATAAAFTDDGWFRSGDLGYLDGDGYLFIADRLKDMIISGGENIYPAEVENLLSDIPGVSGVAVIGMPDEQWGEVPWAVVTMRDGKSLDTAAARAHLDGRLARFKLPKRVVVVDELPRTASGKVRKAQLRESLASTV